MSLKLVVASLVVMLGGCTNTKDFCYLDDHQRKIVLENLESRLAELDTESTKAVPSTLLTKDGVLSRDGEGCYASFSQESKNPEFGVLDGGGGIYINMDTLQPGKQFWYSW